MRYVTMIVLLTGSAVSSAADWTPIGRGPGYEIFGDRSSVTIYPNSQIRRAWFKLEHTAPQSIADFTYTSTKILYYADCRARRVAEKSVFFYDKTGKVV